MATRQCGSQDAMAGRGEPRPYKGIVEGRAVVNPKLGGCVASKPRDLGSDRGYRVAKSLEFGVFGFGLGEDGDVGGGVFPDGEEVLVGGAGFGGVAGEGVGAGETELG
jgi:hypothetical protein